MTSISQQASLSSQVPSSASLVTASVSSPSGVNETTSTQAPAGRSYANATRKFFSPTTATVAGAASHGKNESISPVNGKVAIPPAVPTLGGPTIVNGSNAMSPTVGPGDHSRKPSVTISAAGTTGQMPNGGPTMGKVVGGNAIQFGSMSSSASPTPGHPAPHAGLAVNSLAVAHSPNPRITSPQTSPSPIPQPPASGGRPPPSLPGSGNAINFGNMSGETDASRHYRQSMPSGALTPGMSTAHLRRESSHSSQAEMANSTMGPHNGKAGYGQGRGRNYGNQYAQTGMPYSPSVNFRAPPNPSRGGQPMAQQYSNPGRALAPPFPHSPHQAARSPSLTSAQPIHPQAGQMPMTSPHMPPGTPYGSYSQQMGQQQNYPYGMPQQFDPNYSAMYGQYMHPGMQFMQPASPRPPYGAQTNQQHYVSGQYASQPAPMAMSRTSSAISDRPPSTATLPPTPMTPASHQNSASRSTNSPGPKSSNFQIPVRKSAGIVIKDPNSGAVKTFEKPPASPAAPSKSPAIISDTLTPPPPSHAEATPPRSESKVGKTDEEKKNDMRDAIAKKIEADKEEERREKENGVESAQTEVPALEAVSQSTSAVPIASTEPKMVSPQEPRHAEVDDEVERKRKEEEEDAMYAEMERKEQEAEEAYKQKKTADSEQKARKAAEAAANEAAELKRQEAEAEVAEEARLQKLKESEGNEKKERPQLFSQLKKDDDAAATTSPAPSPSVVVDTPTASRAATPVTDAAAMPPPKAVATLKTKPTALKLETSKPVEAPQPSAALTSLRSARFLSVIDDKTYPSGFVSPNPALNTNAPMGRFRYDITFLTQFQPVFVEKPSENWAQKVRDTVGDTSETPASARGTRSSGMMTGRTPSNRGSILPGPAQFGAFGSFQGAGRTTISSTPQQSHGSQRGGAPMRYNTNAPSGFPMAFPSNPITRTASTTSLNHPSSPRNPSHRGQGGRGGSKSGRGHGQTDKEAKTMPLTAGLDLKPIEVTSSGWKPRSVGNAAAGMAGPPPGGDGYLAPDVVQRKVKSALNKMTPNNFDKLATQILDIVGQSKKESDGRTLRQVIQLTFEKATDEAHWAQMYAEFCSRMLSYMTPEIKDETLPMDKNGNVTSGGTLFRKYLLNRCQQEFEAGWKAKLPEKPEGESEEAAMLSDDYYVAAAAKRRGLGLVRFIGELYKLGMLTSRIMHMCVKRLVDFEGMPDEAEVESLTNLLKTIGEPLDAEEKGHAMVDAYFTKINEMIQVDGLPSRLRFMLMDIVDLRRKSWKTKDAKGPVTLDEVRAQAAAAEREKEMQRANDNSRRGGGGNRMPQGRGDARNFSNGGMQPPPDYRGNTVGMDDLRRLGRAGGRPASQPMSFGPTSMFSSRGSNNRRPMGGPAFSRPGDDASAPLRTSTPPSQKKDDKDAAIHQNSYSALAGLEEPTDGHNSPPSSTSSPPVAKATPSIDQRTREKSPRVEKPASLGATEGGA